MNAINIILPLNSSPQTPWHILAGSIALYFTARFILVQLPVTAAFAKIKSFAVRRVYRLPLPQGQVMSELKDNGISLAADAVMLCLVLKAGIGRFEEANFLSSLVIGFVWLEVWFYVAHRSLHSRLLWPIHRLHHDSKITAPSTAFAFSIAERVVLNGGYFAVIGLISYVHPISLAGLGAVFFFNHVYVLGQHSNVEYFSPSFQKAFFFVNSPTHHSLHHSRSSGHFGLTTSFLDKWLGTEFADYREAQVRAYRGEGFASFSERATGKGIARPSALAPHIIDDLRAGRLSLAAVAPGATAFRAPRMYEQPEVAAWLTKEISSFSADVTLDLLLRFDAEQCTWYLKRQNEIFGPMSLNDLSSLKQKNSLRPEDTAFSLKWRLRARPADLPKRLLAAGADTRELYLNRRNPRTPLRHMVTLNGFDSSLRAMTMDVASESSAVYVKSKLNLGDRYRVEFSESGENFQTDAVVMNVQAFGDGYRCGMMFVNPERRATAKWGSLIKKSRTAAA